MKRTLSITLNPAIDITTSAPTIEPGRKLRCGPPRIEPGGGGVNVARVVQELGGACTALVATAGVTGDLLRALLADAGLDSVFIEADGLTRMSFAVHDRAYGQQFRFVLPGPDQAASFAGRALDRVSEILATGGFPYVVASGSLPPGLPDDFYGEIAQVVQCHGGRLILDTSDAPLAAALGRGIFLVRSNRDEAEALARAVGVEPGDPAKLAEAILESGGAEVVILTLGAEGALLASRDGRVRIRSPRVEVVSAVGAGDSFVAALCFALAEEWSLEDACAYGVAAAAAAVTTEATELARAADVKRLYAATARQPDGPAS